MDGTSRRRLLAWRRKCTLVAVISTGCAPSSPRSGVGLNLLGSQPRLVYLACRHALERRSRLLNCSMSPARSGDHREVGFAMRMGPPIRQ